MSASVESLTPRSSSTAWVVGGGVLLLLAIGIGVYFAFRKSPITKARNATPTSPAPTNSLNNAALTALETQFELLPKAQSVNAVLNETTDVGKQYYLYITLSGMTENTWRLSGTLLVEGFGYGDWGDSGARLTVFNAFYNSSTSSAARAGTVTGSSYGSAAIQTGNLDVGSGSSVVSSQEFRIGVRRLNGLYGAFNLRFTCILPVARPFSLRFAT